MTLEELKPLITAQDDQQRQASESVRAAHEKALQYAEKLRDELAGTINQASERETLSAVIEAAAAKVYETKPQREMAALVVGQYASALADMPGYSASVARNGTELFRHAVSGTLGYSLDQRRQVFAALVVAATQKGVQTGLINWPEEWSAAPGAHVIREMAKTLDPEALEAFDAEQSEQAVKLAEAQRYVDALGQATPQLFVVGENSEEVRVTVRSYRGGAITVAGVSFELGDNELSADQFAAVRNHGSFSSYVESGLLEVIQTSELVEAL
ncbi:hypothetical protein BTW10_13055 [Chromohalobacter japonicus]|uniref:Uncharacterized protein n=1 Tax=Chromohalobacter japonicus TaxID=223900 RepID=A0A1Q8TAB5_9GAMM|nr:hypothetical protein [Chromohalobacter japonicus]OLO10629.1 hypothetical protein BTW10_13055 [Chromohalobacter japonicus]